MSRRIIECVPNFSEGRAPAVVDAIASAVVAAGAALLDRTSDPDHNRSVLTFAGSPERVAEAAFRAVERAVELIDLHRHTGVHPRIGAADVVPFVPVEGVTLEECAALAVSVGERIWDELRVPVYLYEAAARRPACVNLADVRRGGFETLLEAVQCDPERRPDIGDAGLHPTAGAVAVGARRFLIAWNIHLATADVAIARRIARAIRASSGGMPCVKALGLPLEGRGLAQVSMNLTDFETTPMHRVFERVRALAAEAGVGIAGSELIGLVPRRALESSAGAMLAIEGFHPGMVLENRIEAALPCSPLDDFLDGLGSAAAAAAAGAMAASLAPGADARRRFFSAAAARLKEPPRTESDWHEWARSAIEVAEEAQQLRSELSAPDAAALALARAAVEASVAAVRAVLPRLEDREVARAIEERLEQLAS